VRSVFRVRAYLAYAIILFIAMSISVQPAMAFTQMAIPFVTTCNAIYMEPTEFASASIAENNNVNIVDTSVETLNNDFPAFADGIHLGPVVTSGTAAIDGVLGLDRASFNVLPFGPVNLAFPSIMQTADETCAYQRTYFFTDVSI
jgi:hypothetical protein